MFFWFDVCVDVNVVLDCCEWSFVVSEGSLIMLCLGGLIYS